MTDQNVKIAFLRVEAIVGTSVHTMFGEDHKSHLITKRKCGVERGDLASAHYCLNYAVELLIRVVYALNREFLPAPNGDSTTLTA